MAYTKTNLNETTETVAVDMTAEDIENNETTETVVEQNARAYSKTVWNESTPITADRLNKIEDGIASALPLTGGMLTGALQISGHSKIMTIGTGANDVYIANSSSGAFLQLKDDGLLRYNNNIIYHEGTFNPATKLDAGAFSVFNRDLLIHGKRALVGFNAEDGDYLSINFNGDFANGVAIQGLTVVERIQNSGNLVFSKIGGGGLNACIANSTLQAATGNGQMMNVGNNNAIYVGNPNTHLALESASNPVVNVGPNSYHMYHTGNKPTPEAIGALPIYGGRLNGSIEVPGESKFYNGSYTDPWHGQVCAIKASGNVAVQGQMRLNNGSEAVFHEVCNARDIGMYLNNNNWGIYDYQKDRSVLRYNMDGDRVEVQGKRVATWEGSNPAHYMFRYGSGLGGANGYITFSY